ncbi:hypothetical protein K502DRAFT_325723 [Neoconidiobolus thromboides FSU 785]|nr:hypothetical protein K502DRAFT_325723 [Neoconidiobolus thromboides FSU 785]
MGKDHGSEISNEFNSEVNQVACEKSITSNKQDEHRTGSSFGAYFNIVCVVAGTGTLGLPYAIHTGGWVTLVLFFIAAILAMYTGKLLIECLYYKPGERLEEFPDIGEAAFGKFGRYFVKVFHYSILLSCACLYILLTGLNIHKVSTNLNNNTEILSQQIWTLLAGIIIIIPTTLLKTLKEVAWLAAFGAFATFAVVIAVVVVGGLEMSSVGYVQPSTKVVEWSGLPLAMATIAFSYSGNVVYPHVEVGMKSPKRWNFVLLGAIVTITTMYVIVGVAGYLVYGSDVKSPIIDSLLESASYKAGAIFAYLVITLHVILAAPIYLCSFCLEQESWLKIDRKYMSATRELIFRAILRTVVGLVLTVIAIYVPYFNDLMALIGAVSNCIIIFLVPLACHYKLFGFKNRAIWEYVLSTLCVIVGVLGLILGSIDSVKNLIADFEGTRVMTSAGH